MTSEGILQHELTSQILKRFSSSISDNCIALTKLLSLNGIISNDDKRRVNLALQQIDEFATKIYDIGLNYERDYSEVNEAREKEGLL